MTVKTDCKYFKGDIPCKYHKTEGVHCEYCPHYQKLQEKILIIKLGAAGDVIRTTPILRKLRKLYPDAKITWLTNYPDLVPKNYVNEIIKYDLNTALWLISLEFDFLFNLDKDKEAIALSKLVLAKVKKGYTSDEYGRCVPFDDDAEHKWLTGLFDDISKANTKSYPQEIFEILDLEYNKEKYILELPNTKISFNLPENKKIIGLNTGCGTRWLTRLWGKENWIKLSDKLYENGYFPLLLGGPTEDELNKDIEKNSKAAYLGTFPLKDFLHLVNQCDLVVTSVTMAMHIAIGLEKKLVLLNNIFNKYEFELYDLGVILQPDKECLGCYKNTCPVPCMSTIKVSEVFNSIVKLLEK